MQVLKIGGTIKDPETSHTPLLHGRLVRPRILVQSAWRKRPRESRQRGGCSEDAGTCGQEEAGERRGAKGETDSEERA